MTQEKIQRNEQNGKAFGKLMTRIGIAMIIQTAAFQVLESALLILTEILLQLEVAEDTVYLIGELIHMGIYIASFLFPTLLLRFMLKKAGAERGTSKEGRLPRLTPVLLVAAIAINFAASYLNTFLVTMLLPIPTLDSAISMIETDGILSLILNLISVAVIPAVVEELLFRGTVMNAMLPYGRATAIIGSAVLFGLMHGNILQILYTTLMGVILGVIYARTRSLLCCMLIHFVNNAISVVQESLPSLLEESVAVRINGALEFSIMHLGAVAVLFCLITYGERKRPEESGSFGVVFEPTAAYTRYPMEGKTCVKRFFSPTVIVFTALSAVSMLGTFLSLVLWGII